MTAERMTDVPAERLPRDLILWLVDLAEERFQGDTEAALAWLLTDARRRLGWPREAEHLRTGAHGYDPAPPPPATPAVATLAEEIRWAASKSPGQSRHP